MLALMLNTGSSNPWVIDGGFVTQQCDGFGCHYYRRKFNSKKSSSFLNGNTTLFLKYASRWSGGPLVKDTVSFGGLTVKQQEFVDATGIDDSFGGMPFDGILGLGWPALSVGITPPMQNLLSSLDSPLFTIWIDNKLDVGMGENTGLTTYGAIDSTNCHSKVGYAPLTSETYWQFAIDSFSVDTFSEKKQRSALMKHLKYYGLRFPQNLINHAISDTGTSWLGLPASVVNVVANLTGAQYDPIMEEYSVDCSTVKTQPDLVFTINGVQYNVPPQEYIISLDSGSNQVMHLFQQKAPNTW
ncbi:unnamed protein product [Angiostrongylus costaricensis]|uniref:Peptidase A1 domain-containing protein n=1 Tax=Angiostrongylus costaricensis TaxID=334426 RepID=A0A0R3Q265_ANGCS|nr:unnamed protein product [Angiostrongylus costaricensis]